MEKREELEQKRAAIILHWKSGKTNNSEIVKLLKGSGVNKILVWRTIRRFKNTGTTKIRGGSGRPRTKRTPAALRRLKARSRRLHFVEKGVKVCAKNYLEDVLEPVVKPLNTTLFQDQPWTFQRDSAPAHKAKIVQNWLKNNIPDFISTEEWPSASPDLNPLDYAVWSKLEAKACAKPHTSREALMRSLVRELDKFPLESLRNSVEEWRPRLQQCISASGGNFEM